jgi:hypothetical protein
VTADLPVNFCYLEQMSELNRNDYLAMRRRYRPDNVDLVIVAESPPAGGNYFYNPDGKVSEPLFAAMMLRLGFSPTNKDDGLRKFQKRGWILVDATYEPVNALTDTTRNKIIARDYRSLRDDLLELKPDRSVRVVLTKANVCQKLAPLLLADGFKVINNGVAVPFPSHGQQKKFAEKFSAVLKAAGIETAEP